MTCGAETEGCLPFPTRGNRFAKNMNPQRKFLFPDTFFFKAKFAGEGWFPMIVKGIHAYCHKLKKQRRNKKSTHNPRRSPFKTRRIATQTVDVFNEQELLRRVTLSFNRAASCAEHSPLCCLLHGSSNSKPVTK